MEVNEGIDNSAATGNAGDSSQSDSDGSGTDTGRTQEDGLTPQQLVQRESTRRGREMATLKGELSALKESIDSLVRMNVTSPVVQSDKPPVEFITTPEELETYNAWKEKKQIEKRKGYANQYILGVKNLASTNPELHAEIEKELLDSTTRFESHSNFEDAAYDAQQNYRIAENIILKRKLSTTKTKFRSEGDGTGTGVTVDSQDNTRSTKKVELDEYSQKFLKAMNVDQDTEWVKKSLLRKDSE